MKLTILLLFLPTVLAAQVNTSVDPIISQDYTEQVRKLRSSIDPVDSVAYKRNTMLRLKGQFSPGTHISRLKIADGFMQISPVWPRTLKLSGSYSGTIEFKNHNRLPGLQNDYAQGRSSDGALTWRGAETGEMFSYGPALSSLEFDGSSYPYDQSGKLVPAGTGNGNSAHPYREGIFRTAMVQSHQLRILSELYRYGKRSWNFGLKLGHGNEQLIIRDNKGSSNSLATELGTSIKWLTIKGTYLYSEQERTTANRNGLLNRAYQNAILTPVSFSNEQGTTLGEGQRSYSDMADNPWYLLRDNKNKYNWREHNGSLLLVLEKQHWYAKIHQTLQQVKEEHTERYRPGTFAWADGQYTNRSKRDLNYQLQSQAAHEIEYDNNDFESRIQFSHTFNSEHTRIRYQPDNSNYNYQRSSHDLFINTVNKFKTRNVTVILNAGNKGYISNTAVKNKFLLPSVDMGITLENVLRVLTLNASASYHMISRELAINKPMNYTNLLQYSVGDISGFRPVNEVSGFRGVSTINNREWDAHLNLYHRRNFSLTSSFYIKNIYDDIYPVFENGGIVLKNLADLRTKGMDLTFGVSSKRLLKNVYLNSSLSVFSYRTLVTKVREGYNFTPIAGFRNVHKTLVQGQAPGVIVGNAYQRDVAGNMVIGADGFPLVNPSPTLVGNPIPDFVAKWSNNINWKWFALGADLEWKKGGQVWNGTQAVLDYYGRSANSAAERNITGYVFKGVSTDGHINEIPVKFYDPSQGVETNRWTRYGITGVAEQYVQKADYLRLNTVGLTYRINLNRNKQQLKLVTYVNNILLWSPYKGAGPDQLLYDQPNTSGLDFFNLPAVKTYGFNVTYQF
ncbi:hypothetical protein [Chitinophaga pinensis]|uniref:TonB-dependent receptor n=1 Tax=Chitinophaga pinensis (strain ATCC 43595 / DSM 2588 / LMG 13176 / NBRC 15968 / NCIMB 11800 / UQM 2034) TaxID=485918 RepID=A0A979G3Q4_CHIPD|nr:hypothetical protein [Chitinophaga pinensis]ACU60101.1 hypothetical protein Cpin_2619 [Chitinophaga pinensis DSM 2588]